MKKAISITELRAKTQIEIKRIMDEKGCSEEEATKIVGELIHQAVCEALQSGNTYYFTK